MPPIILITTIALLVIFLFIYFVLNKKEKRPVDYYNLFIMGIIWLGAGVPLQNYALCALGLIFMTFGLVNRDKWKANRRKWNDLDQKEQKMRMWIMTILGIIVLLGFGLMYLDFYL